MVCDTVSHAWRTANHSPGVLEIPPRTTMAGVALVLLGSRVPKTPADSADDD